MGWQSGGDDGVWSGYGYGVADALSAHPDPVRCPVDCPCPECAAAQKQAAASDRRAAAIAASARRPESTSRRCERPAAAPTLPPPRSPVGRFIQRPDGSLYRAGPWDDDENE